jgi:ketosteroid isomerase-like protein
MGIELKTLIEDTCRQFERNFSAGDLARLVSDYYHSDVLIVGEGIGRLEGHEGALRYFGGAIAAYSACEMTTGQIIPTAAGAIELGSVKLVPREDAAPMMFAYAVSWRRENSTMKVVLDYFAPVTI